MYEIYRFSGIALTSLFYLYLGICCVLTFFKYNSILKRIAPETDDEYVYIFTMIYFIFSVFSLIMDFDTGSSCASAILHSFSIGCVVIGVVLCVICTNLSKLRDKLPER